MGERLALILSVMAQKEGIHQLLVLPPLEVDTEVRLVAEAEVAAAAAAIIPLAAGALEQ